MELTNETFVLYAAKYYDNPFCFSEAEFHKDLSLIGTIKRMISWINNGEDINVHLLINNVISFYNVFENHAASKLLEFRVTEEHVLKLNSVLLYLSLPLIGAQEYDLLFHRRIAQGYKQ